MSAQQLDTIVEKALTLWGIAGAKTKLAAARENAVFRVDAGSKLYALRLHRQGYRTDAELCSELKWMDAVGRGGISVPAPLLSASGEMLHIVDGVQVDILTWLSGAPLADVVDSMAGEKRCAVFAEIGQQMARLHDISDAWNAPDGFTRCAWDRSGLLGDAPLWDRFWDNPTLSSGDRKLFVALREKANADLTRVESNIDYGLIHADLVSANIMVDGDSVHLIDFDDGGHGFRLFEIATALLKFSDSEDYPALRAALISGYVSVRPIELSALDLFMVLRAATYVGWIITRIDEENSDSRNQRVISKARHLAEDYLAS